MEIVSHVNLRFFFVYKKKYANIVSLNTKRYLIQVNEMTFEMRDFILI